MGRLNVSFLNEGSKLFFFINSSATLNALSLSESCGFRFGFQSSLMSAAYIAGFDVHIN
jgi:hypothetical protein